MSPVVLVVSTETKLSLSGLLKMSTQCCHPKSLLLKVYTKHVSNIGVEVVHVVICILIISVNVSTLYVQSNIGIKFYCISPIFFIDL